MLEAFINRLEVMTFFGYSFSQAFVLFFFWAFIGWCVETCYMTLETGQFQNRGFLNGPICPIYGFGVLIVAYCARPISYSILLTFFSSMILCTAVELTVGVGMEKHFHNTWWDYSHEKFNYKGDICLKNSIIWGLGCLIVIRIAHPVIEELVMRMPVPVLYIICIVIALLIIPDMIVSVCAVEQLNYRMRQLQRISEKLKASSVLIGENLADETLELKAKYDKLISKKDAAQERLVRAFPTMKSRVSNASLQQFRHKLTLRRQKKDVETVDNAADK